MASPSGLILAFFFLRLSCPADGRGDSCATNKAHQITLNSGADAYMGVLVEASHTGPGMMGCGPYRAEGVAQFDSLIWALQRANKDFGQIGRRIVHDSFIPGIKLGLHVYDTCGHRERAVEALGEMFPVLREGLQTCSPLVNDTLLALGVIDLTGVTTEDEYIRKLLQEYGISSLMSKESRIVPQEDKSKALLTSLSELKWREISILVEEKYNFITLAKTLIEDASSYNICVSVVERINSFDSYDDPSAWEENNLYKLSQALEVKRGVLVVALEEDSLQKRFGHYLLNSKHANGSYPHLVFVNPPGEELTRILRNLSSLRTSRESGLFWFVSSSPSIIGDYHRRWMQYQNNQIEQSSENSWIFRYLEQERNCTLASSPSPNSQRQDRARCQSLKLKENHFDNLKVSKAVQASLHGFFSLSNAFKEAWKTSCKNRKGTCGTLQDITRRTFLQKFLVPLDFSHSGPGSRSPPELKGSKVKGDPEAKLHHSPLSLYWMKYRKPQNYFDILEVVKIEGSKVTTPRGKLESLTNVDNRRRPIEECSERSFSDEIFLASRSSFGAVRLATPKAHIYRASPDGILVVGLFPVHETSKDGTDCGRAFNKQGLQEVEAFMWAVEQINLHQKLLPQTHLGFLVLDTCGSKIRGTNQITNLIKNDLNGLPQVKISQVWSVITSMDSQSARVAGEILGSLNISSMNLGTSDAHSPYALQMRQSVNVEAEAIIHILRYLGWDFITLMSSEDDLDSTAAANAFNTLAKVSHVCVASHIRMPLLNKKNKTEEALKIMNLLEKSAERGARGLVTFLTGDHLKFLLDTLRTAGNNTEGNMLTPDTIFIIGSTNWGHSMEELREYEDIYNGLIFLNDGQKDVEDFSIHFRLLTPANSTRNPWFNEWWKEKFGCHGSECEMNTVSLPVVPYHPVPTTPRVIQAIFSFSAALTQLLTHLCPHAEGKMCPGLPRWRQRVVLNEFLRNTEVSRVDRPAEFFQFNDNFHGNTPIEIFNLRSSKHPTATSELVQIGSYINSKLEMSPAMSHSKNGTFEPIPLDLVESSCVIHCKPCTLFEPEYGLVASDHNLYIVAIFDLHERGPKPLECGPINANEGIQNLESFLWSLRDMNLKQTNESHLELGVIILDTCKSKEKIVRDLTNIFTEGIKHKLASPDHIVGVVIGSTGETLTSVLDVVQPYHVTTVSTRDSHSRTAQSERYPTLLTLPSSNAVVAESLLSVVNFWGWQLVSVVSSSFGNSMDIHQHLLRKAKESKLVLSVVQLIPKESTSMEFMLDVWASLAEGAEKGSRVIILLLETPHDLVFFQTASKLYEKGLIKNGDFTFILTKSPQPFVKTRIEALGSLIIEPNEPFLEEFATYFKNLSLANHKTPNKWFTEFWSKINSCRGSSCYRKENSTLAGLIPVKQAKGVPEAVDAAIVFQDALQEWQKHICTGATNITTCAQKIAAFNSRLELYRMTRSSAHRGANGRPVSFSAGGHNSAASLQILNYKKLEDGKPGVIKLGRYNDVFGLSLNSSLATSYSEDGNEMPMIEFKSECIDFEACADRPRNLLVEKKDGHINAESSMKAKGKAISTMKTGEGYTQFYPHHRFGISILTPLHHQGKDFFSCGEFYNEAVFQNLVAITYALSKINENDAGIGLGAIVFDHCNRIERARDQLFSYFSGETQENYADIVMTKERIVASIDFDDNTADAVASILTSNYIPHFSSPVAGVKLGHRRNHGILTSIPTRFAEIQVYISLLKSFEWKYVSALYDNTPSGEYLIDQFRRSAKENDICIGDSLVAPTRVSEEYAKKIVETLSVSWKPRVILLLLDHADNINTVLKVFAELGYSEQFVFLAGQSWGNLLRPSLEMQRIFAGSLTFTLESRQLPDFQDFYSNMTIDNHDPIPKKWFDEFFQHKFNCKITNSPSNLKHFAKECTGAENIHSGRIVQDPYVFHTILSVNTVAHGLKSYIRKQCPDAQTFDQCTVIQAELLLEIEKRAQMSLNNTRDNDPFDGIGAYGYHIWNFGGSRGQYEYVNVGKWQNGRLLLRKSTIEFKIGPYPPVSICKNGPCLEICSSQSPAYAVITFPDPLPIDINFRNVYGIVTSSLSLLGIILILITLVYFMISFPTAEGTSVLGYFILIGCLMIYAVNFAFIFQPSVGVCAIRRFLMGLAYAMVYSSMFVKVIHSWRIATYGCNHKSFANPGVLLLVSCALTMVQAILGAAWLILYPPQVDLLGNKFRCSPADNFETELIISMIYVMILIIATLIFCAETWQCRDVVKETRWILLTSVLTVFAWLIWTIVATQAPIPFRDPAVVIGNLVCATVTLLLLYARRFYIYSHLNEDFRDSETRSQVSFPSVLTDPYMIDQKSLNPFPSTSTINPLREMTPGTQFIGDQEVSFHTVTLPPEKDFPRSRFSSRHSRYSRRSFRRSRSRRRSRRLSFSDELPDDLNMEAFDSSDEELGIHPNKSFNEEVSDHSSLESNSQSSNDSEDVCSTADVALDTSSIVDFRLRPPSIRRVGSRQMLVFLTDGNSIGEVSRI